MFSSCVRWPPCLLLLNITTGDAGSRARESRRSAWLEKEQPGKAAHALELEAHGIIISSRWLSAARPGLGAGRRARGRPRAQGSDVHGRLHSLRSRADVAE